MSKPKILYVTHALSSLPHIGVMIRSMNIARQLTKFANVSILTVNRSFNEDSIKLAQSEFENFHVSKLKPYSKNNKLAGTFIKKYHMHSPWTNEGSASKKDQMLFERLAEENDIVWFHTLRSAFPFRIPVGTKTVLDFDDLNCLKYKLKSIHGKTFRLRLSARVMSYKWNFQEFKALSKYCKTIVCSDSDKHFLGASKNIHVISNGFSMPETKPQFHKTNGLRIGFIGALNYHPNTEGLAWFKDNVWPLILKEKPDMKLRVIGSISDQKHVVKADGFEYLGYVQNTCDEFNTWSAMIAPILTGGGTRIKIIEAFSKMCPVVSTELGAHGIDVKHRSNICLANKPVDFANYCLELSNSTELANTIAEAAWALFEEKYTWDVIGESIKEIVTDLVQTD